MSTASIGVRASKPFPLPPGIPPGTQTLYGGTRADIKWQVTIQQPAVQSIVAIGPWTIGGLIINRISTSSQSRGGFSTTPDSAPILRSRIKNGSTLFVQIYDFFGSGTGPDWVGTSPSLFVRSNSATSLLTLIPGSSLVTPKGTIGLTFSGQFLADPLQIESLRWEVTLASNAAAKSDFCRLGYIGIA